MTEGLTLEKIESCLTRKVVSINCAILYNDSNTWEFLTSSKDDRKKDLEAKAARIIEINKAIELLKTEEEKSEKSNKKKENELNRVINDLQAKLNKDATDKKKYQAEVNTNNIEYTTKSNELNTAINAFNNAHNEYNAVKHQDCRYTVRVKTGEECSWYYVIFTFWRVSKKKCHDVYRDEWRTDHGCVSRKNSRRGAYESSKKDKENKEREKGEAKKKLDAAKTNLKQVENSEATHKSEKSKAIKSLEKFQEEVKNQNKKFEQQKKQNNEDLSKAKAEHKVSEVKKSKVEELYSVYESYIDEAAKEAKTAETTIVGNKGYSDIATIEESLNMASNNDIEVNNNYGY